jgi:diaminohydroxyphosphoribosylaminopyrimidine deaminase/5-amino-6-(5-phosphoribosylamino)uracil reductase
MHEQFLLAALEQAKYGRGQCSPNPSVGAVAVQNGLIIAQSYHQGAGSPHAEPLVLQQFAKNTPNVILYVTLEPCNHWGRTPPCVDAIIDHGIERVVYAKADPNPIVAGNDTAAHLRAHGIETIHHPLAVIDEFYQSYCYWVRSKKPWITFKIAQSLDGKIAYEGGVREQLSNDLCQKLTHQQRANADIILTTSRTINLDNPQLNARLPGIVKQKKVAIIDLRGHVDVNATVFQTSATCHIYHGKGKRPSINPPNVEYHELTNTADSLSPLVLGEIIEHLGAAGYHDVWVEAGSMLFNAMHEANLVNRTIIYLVPRVLGTNAYSLYTANALFNKKHTVSWQVLQNNAVATVDWDLE